MLRSIVWRSVSADNHILILDRYSYIWPISRTVRNLMKVMRGDIFAVVEILRCFEETMKKSLYVVYVLHHVMMNGWFIFNSRFSDIRADLRITTCICGALRLHGTGADHGCSSQCLCSYQPAAACFRSGSPCCLAKNLVAAVRGNGKIICWSWAAFMYNYV